MTEEPNSAGPASAATAGALLRAARERQGMTLAALALAIKVAPRKVDALERDRLDELPDLTFARALALTVCRTLRIDAEPVLALLPTTAAAPAALRKLEHLGAGLNAPLGAGRRTDDAGGWLRRPVVWLAALLLIGAAAMFFRWPEQVSRWRDAMPSAASAPALAGARAVPAVHPVPSAQPLAADAASSTPLPAASTAEPAVVIETVHSAPDSAQAASAPDAAPAGALVLRASGESWVEVRDGAGELLLSRTLLAGEAVGVDGALPLRATIGNAVATSVSFRGAAVDLAAATRDNIARIELK